MECPGFIEAVNDRNGCGGVFRGGTAPASLKLSASSPVPEQLEAAAVFRGGTAPASLKLRPYEHMEHLPGRLPGWNRPGFIEAWSCSGASACCRRGLPGWNRPGFIEARHVGIAMGAVNGVFRGGTAPASLKPALHPPDSGSGGRLPGWNRPGFIEASGSICRPDQQMEPNRTPPVLFHPELVRQAAANPRHHRHLSTTTSTGFTRLLDVGENDGVPIFQMEALESAARSSMAS